MVLFNTIDDIAHQSRTFTDDAGVRGYLADLADHLAQARDICARNGQQLHILIGSDHGGTLLPESAVMLPLPQRTQPIEEQTEGEISTPNTTGRSARAAIIADPQQIPAEQRARWYVLDRDRFQLDQHYLAPRGYDYISRRPSGWTHGGLTPEEVVVPLLHLSPQAPHIMPIQLQWIGTMLPRRESVVRVLMRNSNRFPLEHLTLEVDGNVYDRRDQLGPTTSVELELTLPAVATQASETPVVWSVRYRTFGVEHRDHGQTMLAMRRLSTEDSNFDDMFD